MSFPFLLPVSLKEQRPVTGRKQILPHVNPNSTAFLQPPSSGERSSRSLPAGFLFKHVKLHLHIRSTKSYFSSKCSQTKIASTVHHPCGVQPGVCDGIVLLDSVQVGRPRMASDHVQVVINYGCANACGEEEKRCTVTKCGNK